MSDTPRIIEKSKMNIYTYLGSCPKRTDEENAAMIKLWRKSWERHGWDAVVLDRGHAEAMPGIDRYMEAVSRFPTRNDPTYELICFERWAAMAATGGGLMSDYDVINYGVTPDYRRNLLSVPEGDRITCFQGHVPCLVNGTAVAFGDMCQMFLNYDSEGSQHVSDMLILNSLSRLMPGAFRRLDLVSEFNGPGWKTAGLVHYPSTALKTFKPKSHWIPILEKNRRLRGALT